MDPMMALSAAGRKTTFGDAAVADRDGRRRHWQAVYEAGMKLGPVSLCLFVAVEEGTLARAAIRENLAPAGVQPKVKQ